MSVSHNIGVLSAVQQMVAPNTVAELRPGSAAELLRIRDEIVLRHQDQLPLARLHLNAKTLRCPSQHVHDVRLRHGE